MENNFHRKAPKTTHRFHNKENDNDLFLSDAHLNVMI